LGRDPGNKKGCGDQGTRGGISGGGGGKKKKDVLVGWGVRWGGGLVGGGGWCCGGGWGWVGVWGGRVVWTVIGGPDNGGVGMGWLAGGVDNTEKKEPLKPKKKE